MVDFPKERKAKALRKINRLMQSFFKEKMTNSSQTNETRINKNAPNGLMIEFLQGNKVSGIKNSTPRFGWIVNSSSSNDTQSAYNILVATDSEVLEQNQADVWDSGKYNSELSINVPYQGKRLESNATYFWKVKTWCTLGGESAWSGIMGFSTGEIDGDYSTVRYPLEETVIEPLEIIQKSKGHYLVDFGKVAFGYLHLKLNVIAKKKTMKILLGERGSSKGVNKRPGGSVRYYKIKIPLNHGIHALDIHPPKNERNTSGSAIRLPEEIGVIAPFRYVELFHCPMELNKSTIKQIAIHYPFNERSSSFKSSNSVLDQIWDLCKYSMKATSFCGVYVDGERERIPYEADAYINQLSHYAVDREFSLARYSHEYLLTNPTWPTEWKQHSVFMAWTDYMYTGNTKSLEENYEILKTKTLEDHAREDGLLNTKNLRDIVDWPKVERDNYEFKEVNTVVNAFYYKTLIQMSDIAAAIGKSDESEIYLEKAEKFKIIFNQKLFDKTRGLFIDGEGAEHTSLHANMMPLAFGLVPEDRKNNVADFIVSKGMACSVYAAQYLLEALYESGRADTALKLMTSKEKRSWYNMLRVGSTITLEAWDNKFKPNQDWNHAWGAVPGNIVPRYLMGVRPLKPGFSKVLIQPQPAFLENASAYVPTIRGPVEISFKNTTSEYFELDINLPINMTAKVGLPINDERSKSLIVDGNVVDAQEIDGYLFVDGIGSGKHKIINNSNKDQKK